MFLLLVIVSLCVLNTIGVEESPLDRTTSGFNDVQLHTCLYLTQLLPSYNATANHMLSAYDG